MRNVKVYSKQEEDITYKLHALDWPQRNDPHFAEKDLACKKVLQEARKEIECLRKTKHELIKLINEMEDPILELGEIYSAFEKCAGLGEKHE
jgi:exonuclease VII small subunit